MSDFDENTRRVRKAAGLEADPPAPSENQEWDEKTAKAFEDWEPKTDADLYPVQDKYPLRGHCDDGEETFVVHMLRWLRQEGHTNIDRESIIRFCWRHLQAPAPSEGSEPTYPCHRCGKLRTKAEGGTVFSVCDSCWDAPSEGSEGEVEGWAGRWQFVYPQEVVDHLRARLESVERENKKLAIKARALDRLPFCPDHRDKVAGKECRECEIDRLQRERDRVMEISDAMHDSMSQKLRELRAEISRLKEGLKEVREERTHILRAEETNTTKLIGRIKELRAEIARLRDPENWEVEVTFLSRHAPEHRTTIHYVGPEGEGER